MVSQKVQLRKENFVEVPGKEGFQDKFPHDFVMTNGCSQRGNETFWGNRAAERGCSQATWLPALSLSKSCEAKWPRICQEYTSEEKRESGIHSTFLKGQSISKLSEDHPARSGLQQMLGFLYK